MELGQVRAAHAVAAHRHFGRAAAELGVSRSTLSAAVRALETDLGVVLFERTTRSVAVTEAGRCFVDRSTAALALLEDAATRAVAAGRGEAGSLVVALVGSALTPPLPRLLRRFRALRPEVDVTVRELTTRDQVDELVSGRADIGFLRPPLPGAAERDLDLVTVVREPLVAVLPLRHPLARSGPLALRALSAEPFVRTPRELGPGFHDSVTALCRQAGFVPDTVQEATQIGSVIGLVAAGFGVSVVPAPPGPVAGVRFVPLRDAGASVDLAMAVPRRPLTPQAAAFTDLVRQAVDGRG